MPQALRDLLFGSTICTVTASVDREFAQWPAWAHRVCVFLSRSVKQEALSLSLSVEALRGGVTYLRFHSSWRTEPGFEPRQPNPEPVLPTTSTTDSRGFLPLLLDLSRGARSWGSAALLTRWAAQRVSRVSSRLSQGSRSTGSTPGEICSPRSG